MHDVLTDVDSYKLSHFKQYPPGTEGLRAYFEARTVDEEIVFFGLQYIIDQLLQTPVTETDVLYANNLAKQHGCPFPLEGWMRVVREHDGLLPLRIRAAPEGTVVPSGNALFTVESTDPALFWLVTWVETALSRVWYSSTVATRSRDLRKFMQQALEESSDAPAEELPFKLHDFGSRGVSSAESAVIGGMAHLVSFMGTDTFSALAAAMVHYHCEVPGFSIPASEHSTITSWGRDGEVDAYRNMLQQFGEPGAIVACVSDSYDIFNAVENLWGYELRQEVIDSGATLVVRPDSGDPQQMVLYCLAALGDAFGYSRNSKGYKVLNNVRVIQGDGVNPHDIRNIIGALMEDGWSLDNVAFGMGGGLLQRMDRDTHKFAFKVCEALIDGEWVPVSKSPVGSHSKRSKAGKLELMRDDDGVYHTVDTSADTPVTGDLVFNDVYVNGTVTYRNNFDEVRARAAE